MHSDDSRAVDAITRYVRWLFDLVAADPYDEVATKNPPSLAEWRAAHAGG